MHIACLPASIVFIGFCIIFFFPFCLESIGAIFSSWLGEISAPDATLLTVLANKSTAVVDSSDIRKDLFVDGIDILGFIGISPGLLINFIVTPGVFSI